MKLDNEIVKEYFPSVDLDIGSSIFEDNYNKSYFFLLPFTEFNVIRFRENFINCFYKDEKVDYIKNGCLYVLVHKNEKLDKHIRSLDNYIYNYYISDDVYMYVMDIVSPDYFKIIKGKYSTVSKSYVDKVKKYNFTSNSKSNTDLRRFIIDIVNKNARIIKMVKNRCDIDVTDQEEYWEKFIPEREIFRYKENDKATG